MVPRQVILLQVEHRLAGDGLAEAALGAPSLPANEPLRVRPSAAGQVVLEHVGEVAGAEGALGGDLVALRVDRVDRPDLAVLDVGNGLEAGASVAVLAAPQLGDGLELPGQRERRDRILDEAEETLDHHAGVGVHEPDELTILDHLSSPGATTAPTMETCEASDCRGGLRRIWTLYYR